ncbi:MAG: CPBP family intramembrane metalloprotease [Clostridia bacterium]|nr:CPBP family intramembrane metalloprotease [Clostridia bacterium]
MDIRNRLQHLSQALRYYIMLMVSQIIGEIIVLLSCGGADIDQNLPDAVISEQVLRILDSHVYLTIIATYLFMALWIWWKHFRKKDPIVLTVSIDGKAAKGVRTSRADMFWAMVAGIGAGVWMHMLNTVMPFELSPFEKFVSQGVEGPVNADGLVIQVLALIVISPIIGEIIFRGLIFSRMRILMHPVAAVFCQALMFASFFGSDAETIMYFALGMILGFIVLKSDSIKAAVVMHMSFNWTGMMAGGFFGEIAASPEASKAVIIIAAAVFILGGYMLFRDCIGSFSNKNN